MDTIVMGNVLPLQQRIADLEAEVERLKGHDMDAVYARARHAEMEVVRLQGVVKALDVLLRYRANRIRELEHEPKEWR